mgnify:CR=1 FL=1
MKKPNSMMKLPVEILDTLHTEDLLLVVGGVYALILTLSVQITISDNLCIFGFNLAAGACSVCQ